MYASIIIRRLPSSPLLLLQLRFVCGLLLLPHEVSQDPYLLVVVLVEVEPKSEAQSDLEQVVVEAFLGDADFFGCVFEGVFLVLPGNVARP